MSLRRAASAAIATTALLLAGCGTTVKPPERMSGFEDAEPATLATVQENDHIFLRQVDGHDVEHHFHVDIGSHKVYRQFQIPAGTHEVTVKFSQGNYDALYLNAAYDVPSPDRAMTVRIEAGHSYVFASNANQLGVAITGHVISQWDPALIDQATKKIATLSIKEADQSREDAARARAEAYHASTRPATAAPVAPTSAAQ